jgi:hypothetical protein
MAMFQVGGERPNYSLRRMAGQSYLLVLRSFCPSLLYRFLNPFIQRIGGKFQIDRMHNHVHVDLVFY